jgi:ADP-ribose pyrophosphatase
VTFRVLGSTTLCEAGFLSVERLELRGPGDEVLERHVVRHPGAVVVVPLTAEREVLMVRQYRAATGGELLEVPAGKRDVDGEAPSATAARELEEETGHRAGALHLLCEFYNSPGFTDEYTHLFLATDLEVTARAAVSAEEEAMTIERVPLEAVDRLIADGSLVDAKSIIGVLTARAHLQGASGATGATAS